MLFPSIKGNLTKIKEIKNGANTVWSVVTIAKIPRWVVFGEINCNIFP